ncbi:arabinosyltransferase EmbA [Gordonia jinhuaensis]|uniref:Arabinosyltransferase A n=1 Tax=Gordonia jinhuaensis TaxID=1517702 RepID=A0A916T939_9ACTN|nr:putative arabinosyltransferase A [Gordonia jinhuaensis]
MIAGLVGIVLCIVTPLLPVTQKTATITWPQGQQLSESTPSVTAPLIEQSAQSMDVVLSCRTLGDVDRDGGVIFSTMPSTAMKSSSRGLFVTANASTITVTSRGATLTQASRADVASADCRELHIWSDPTGVGARFVGLGGANTLGPDRRPQVSGIFSSLTTDQIRAAGPATHVTITIDSRFDSRPSAIKLAAIILSIISVAISLLALAGLDYRFGYVRRRLRRHHVLSALRPRWTDTVVTLVLAVWLFLGAGTADDGYILTMGRVAHGAGYLGNYYRFFDVPEAPFDWYYSFLSLWSQVSTAGLWMHLPALAAGLASWFILSRVLIPRLGAGVRRSAWATWAAAAVFLAFWLPFDSGLRSESVIVLGSLITWWMAEQSIATRRLLPAAAAAIAAGFTLALAPHGVIGLAVLLVSARALLSLLMRRRNEAGLAALVAPIVAAALLVLVIVFRDQTPVTVLDGMRLRRAVGPTLGWSQEYMRYYFLTVTSPDGSLTRRVPVLLLFASLAVTVAVMLRRGRIGRIDPGPTWRVVGATLVTMLLLAFAPTKWTVQFGIYAGFAAALAAAATVAISETASRSARNLWVFVAGLMFALAAATAGYNAWPWAYNLGISWFDRAPVIAGKQVSTIFLVLAVLACAVAVWQHLRLDYTANKGLRHQGDGGSDKESTADRRRLFLASSPIAVIAWLMVVVILALFLKGAAARRPAYTVLSGNLRALTGNTCAMADDVLVETDPNAGMLTSAEGKSASAALAGSESTGFTPNGVASDLTPDYDQMKAGMENVAVGGAASYPYAGGEAGTLGGYGPKTVNGSTVALPYALDPATTPVLGSYGYNTGQAKLTTGWYALPDRDASPLLVFSAAGSIFTVDENGVPEYGQSLTVQFGKRGADGGFEQIGGSILPIDPGPNPPNRPWRNMRVPMDRVPAGATAMRIVADDNNVNPKQWIAVTPPRAPMLETLQSVVGSDAPTLLDFAVAAQFPCQRPVGIHNGVADVPKWRILPDRITAATQSKTWQETEAGGILGISESTTSPTTIPTYLDHDWYRDWGSLQRLNPLVPDAHAASVTTGDRRAWGWTRDGAIRMVANVDD